MEANPGAPVDALKGTNRKPHHNTPSPTHPSQISNPKGSAHTGTKLKTATPITLDVGENGNFDFRGVDASPWIRASGRIGVLCAVASHQLPSKHLWPQRG